MGTFFEQTFGLDRARILARVLEAQTEAYGFIDVPALTRELNYYKSRDALDIGIGDGSFLFKIAAKNPNVHFLGIEQNAEFLSIAQSRLEKIKLPNIQLKQAFFDSQYQKRHDTIIARFTLQHVSRPQEFIKSVYRSLRLTGIFMCIEPVYDFYDCEPAEKIWYEYREKIFATYNRWQSNPNIPKQIYPWLVDAGFKSISSSIRIYSPVTIGHKHFKSVVLTTASKLNLDHPDIWGTSFLNNLEAWLETTSSHPFIAIAHVIALKSNPAKLSITESPADGEFGAIF